MNTYKYIITATKEDQLPPDEWVEVQGANQSEALQNALNEYWVLTGNRSTLAHCFVWISEPLGSKMFHPNGVPFMVHCLEITAKPKAEGVR